MSSNVPSSGSGAGATRRRLIVEAGSRALYESGLRAAGLAGQLLAVALLRDAPVVAYAVASICIVMIQLSGQLDLGVGAVALDAGVRSDDQASVIGLAKAQLVQTRRLRTTLFVVANLIVIPLYLIQDARSSVSFAASMLFVQAVALWNAVTVGPYERALAGLRIHGPPLIGATVGVGVSILLSVAALAFANGSAPALAPIAVALPSALARVAAWFASRRQAADVLPSDGAESLRRDFCFLQLIGIASFGSDLLLAALAGRSEDYVSFVAHARYFLVASGVFAAAIMVVRPTVIRLLETGGPQYARRAFWGISAGTVVLAVLTAIPVFLDLGVMDLFRESLRTDLSLALPLAAWFVLLQVGSVNGQALAALRDTAFQVRQGVWMAAMNVGLSVWLTLTVGPVGVVYGSLISYSAIVAGPAFARLARRSTWERETLSLTDDPNSSSPNHAT